MGSQSGKSALRDFCGTSIGAVAIGDTLSAVDDCTKEKIILVISY